MSLPAEQPQNAGKLTRVLLSAAPMIRSFKLVDLADRIASGLSGDDMLLLTSIIEQASERGAHEILVQGIEPGMQASFDLPADQ